MPWLPQSIQKRVFRYILDRLALFSNLDLEKLDVSLGTQSELSLHEVQLDTERLNIPGVFVRDGRIKNLNLKLGVGGVQIHGDQLELTIAVSMLKQTSGSGDLSEDITALLSKTTADIAETMMKEQEDEDEEDEETGYGIGEFNNVVSRMVDLAISQLMVQLTNISLRVILDDSTTLELVVEKSVMNTIDGVRHVDSDNVNIYLIKEEVPSEGAGQYNDNEVSESESEDEDEDDHNDLMQSAVFSHEEASTMYMSAMQSVVQPEMHELRDTILHCDSAKFTFEGIMMANLSMDLGVTTVSIETLPQVLESLMALTSSNDISPSKVVDSIIEDGEPTFSWKHVNVKQVMLDCAPVRLGLDKISVTNKESILVDIEKCYMLLTGGDERIFWFNQSDGQSDLSCRVSDDKVTLVVPNAGHFKLSLDVIDSVSSVVEKLMGVSQPDDGDRKDIRVQTNTFSGTLSTGSVDIECSIWPVSLENDAMKIGQVDAKFANDEHIGITSLVLSIGGDGQPVVVKQSDSSEVQASVNTRLTVDNVKSTLSQSTLVLLGEDFKQLKPPSDGGGSGSGANVAKKMQRVRLEDVVTFAVTVKSFECAFRTDEFGVFDLDIRQVETNLLESGKIQISVFSVHVSRDCSDIDDKVSHTPLLHNANPHMKDRPMVFVELYEGKPTEVRFWNVAVEYHVRLLKLFGDDESKSPSPQAEMEESTATITSQELRFPVYFIDCVVGLSPLELPSRGQLVIRDANADIRQGYNGVTLDVVVRKATLMLVDDVQYLESIGGGVSTRGRAPLDQVSSFKQQGYVPVATVTSICAQATNIVHGKDEPKIKVDLSSELLVLETCADSTQTMIQVFQGLRPSIEGGDDIKYHTEVIPFNLLQSIEESAFSEGQNHVEENDDLATTDFMADDVPSNLDFVESYYAEKASRSQWTNSSSGSSNNNQEYSRADLLLDQDLSILAANNQGVVEPNHSSQRRAAVFEQRTHSHEEILDFSEDHFGKIHDDDDEEEEELIDNEERKAPQESPRDSPEKNKHKPKKPIPPLRIHIRDTKVVWNLHDGYDWVHTQEAITKAVKHVEVQVGQAKREPPAAPRPRNDEDDDEDEHGPETEPEPEVFHDMLFNSIYIGMPSDHDPAELRRAINRELNDDASETASNVSSRSASVSPSPSRAGTELRRSQPHAPHHHTHQKLRLKRSRNHKVKIEVTDVDADVLVYAGVNDSHPEMATVAGEEGLLLNRVDVRVRDFEIIDNVPTSTWNKFVSYMRSAGERESDASMIHFVVDSVKPVPEIATSEVIMNVSVLPLRLHVDQDTLDFLTRFFEFKDERFLQSPEVEEVIFIQKFDIRAVRIKLDYKPKKVDYAGLKSGHVTEFMNFFILDEAEMILRRIVLYGVPGFPRLAQSLHNIWMPDIRTTQLGDVLAGIAPVRSLIRLGSGVKDLVAVPVREYRKDGRLIRSLQKGAVTFAKNTTNELVKFGAKVAAGTQTFLESAESAMGGTGAAGRSPRKRVSAYSDDVHAFDDISDSEDYHSVPPDGPSARQVSLYANQPRGVNQGLHVAYTSLGRNLAMARNAVGNIGAQTVDQGGNAQDAAKAVARAAPIALIRPMIGATEAVSKTLLGVTNQMDPDQMADVDDKYKQDTS